jgi:hypothetical protein
MRKDAYLSDAQAEPDIIVFGRPEPAESGQPDDRPGLLLRRLRRFVEPGLVVVGAGVMLLAGYAMGSDGSSVARPAAPPSVSRGASPSSSPQASVSRPWLVAPQAAVAGQTITVLAHRNRRLCGAAELRFDGAPVAQRLGGYAGPSDSGREDVFVLMTVPLSARAGHHVVELHGPIQGGRGDSACADVPEHQGRLATTTVAVGPRR